MASPFNVPDEFVNGFLKSGQDLLQAFTGTGGASAVRQRRPRSPPRSRLRRSRPTTGSSRWPCGWAWWPTPAASAPPARRSWPPKRGDRRFQGEGWQDNPWYSLLQQTYLLNSRLLGDMVESADLDERQKHKLRFFARQFIDSMSPANFAATNPEAIKVAVESGGESIRAGFANLLKDMKSGRISITDETAFEVGRNVAVSEGSVVFQNELFQLIQYAPLTEKVATTAAADRAAVHQQVLHPRPAARELLRALRRRTGADGVRGLVAQPRRIPQPHHLGRLPRIRRHEGDRGRAEISGATRSTRSAGASAARSCRRRWR